MKISAKPFDLMVVILLLSFLLLMPLKNASAKEIPTWPFGSNCKVSELGKSKSNGSQVCIKQGNSYKWVKTLSTKDVYDFAPFCLLTINGEVSGSVCGWTENIGLKLVPRYVPKDLCIGALRKIVYLESRYYVSGKYVDTSNLPSQVYKILADEGCFKG